MLQECTEQNKIPQFYFLANNVKIIEETSNPLDDKHMSEEGEAIEVLDTCYPKSC